MSAGAGGRPTAADAVRSPRTWELPGQDGAQVRELTEQDAPELHALIERNRARLGHWLNWARDQDEAGTLAFIRAARADSAANRGLQLAIVLDGAIVGMVGVPHVDWGNRRAEIGYWLDERHEGRGLMSASVATLAEHAFAAWELNRLEIRTDIENARSRAVAERLGFRYEGVLRQAYWVGDRYSDDAVYSLLATDAAGPGATLDGGK